MDELISIIVPIYRVEKYLDQCIQSIQNQTYTNLEIILIDDGSDDQCPQICDRYAQADQRIKVIHKENGGQDSARKVGMLAANGKYIGYVDGDDWIEPGMYENLMRSMQEYGVEIVESGVIDTWENKEERRVICLEERCYKEQDFIEKVESKLLYFGFFYEYGISPYLWNKLFIKEKIMKYQMMDGLNKIFDDSMVCLPCIAESKKIYVSHDCYYHYRVRTNSHKRGSWKNVVPKLMKCYPEFYMRFEGTKVCAEDGRQIKYFVMYWLLNKAPYAFDDIRAEKILIPYGGLDKKDRIILYGAGAVGIHLKEYMSRIEGSNIVCWADRNYKDLQKTLDVQDPRNIVNYEYDYIIISMLRETTVQSAKRDIIKLGVPEEKIRWIEQKYIDDPGLLLSKIMDEQEVML